MSVSGREHSGCEIERQRGRETERWRKKQNKRCAEIERKRRGRLRSNWERGVTAKKIRIKNEWEGKGEKINTTQGGRKEKERIQKARAKRERESKTSAKPMQTWAHIPKPLLSLHLFFPLLKKTA